MYNRTNSVYTKYFEDNTDYLFGSSYTYDEEANLYTITGETQVLNDWENDYDKISSYFKFYFYFLYNNTC